MMGGAGALFSIENVNSSFAMVIVLIQLFLMQGRTLMNAAFQDRKTF